MNIGILGSGVVGQTLGAAFLQEKHQVMLGSRDTTKKEVQEWLQKNPGATVGNFEVVAKFADIIILAVSGASAMNALQISGGENLNGKIIIDVTNPLAATPPENGVLSFLQAPMNR
jgi:predicted dinucleotide-binding enzyme